MAFVRCVLQIHTSTKLVTRFALHAPPTRYLYPGQAVSTLVCVTLATASREMLELQICASSVRRVHTKTLLQTLRVCNAHKTPPLWRGRAQVWEIVFVCLDTVAAPWITTVNPVTLAFTKQHSMQNASNVQALQPQSKLDLTPLSIASACKATQQQILARHVDLVPRDCIRILQALYRV